MQQVRQWLRKAEDDESYKALISYIGFGHFTITYTCLSSKRGYTAGFGLYLWSEWARPGLFTIL
ncbi:MAG: hypothetical protein A2030_10205 [Chloroflexi bacterium RBG_19FT_COMBO_50_10]|nr:MAG: hypothetical protein A2030_10205 [Chloroflexi bacterium RBG_19FT_COMBO_50_10]